MSRARQSGFTVIEFAVSSLSAAIVLLTVGTMLYTGYQTWSRNHGALAMHRDAALALRPLLRAVRSATPTEVHIPNAASSPSTSGARVFVRTQCVFRAAANGTYDAAGGPTLVLDLDTTTGGNELVLVRDGVQSFTCTYSTNGVAHAVLVDLVISNANDQMELHTDIYLRNMPE